MEFSWKHADVFENLHKAKAGVLPIEAGRTIVLVQPEVVALADRYGLCIVAIRNTRPPDHVQGQPAR